jgi:hypothetical protein
MSRDKLVESNNSGFIVRSDIGENEGILAPDFKEEEKEVSKNERRE